MDATFRSALNRERDDAIRTAYKHHHSALIGALMRDFRDLELAQDLLHEAFASALEKWIDIPERPAAWLLTTARRKGIDRQRHERVVRDKSDHVRLLHEESIDEPDLDLVGGFRDEQLRLIYTCCHPSLSSQAQVALTLRTVCGLTTGEIAKSFLIPEATLAQRIVRAKKKIRLAGIPYKIPDTEVLPERTATVLSVIYLVFNEGYQSSTGNTVVRVDLCDEAIRLGRLVESLIPDEPEVTGLRCLMELHHARRLGRVDENGDLLTLDEQDRTLWDHDAISLAADDVRTALKKRRVGPYQLQASIAAVHAMSDSTETTDWAEIVGLYAVLQRIHPTPVVELNRAAAVAMWRGPQVGLDLIREIEASGDLQNYALLPAAKADLYRRLGNKESAELEYHRAIELTENGSERRYYRRRLSEL